MASTRIIEEERGTYTGHIGHKHNGYYAGNFGAEMRPSAGGCHAPQAPSRTARAMTL
jgi:hypothetical protein